MMGEQPLFTTKAHVFHIDPATKKNWIPSSTGSVNVAFYFDTNRSAYRIISVEGSKPIINSTVVPTMNFTKTSQKFGQWSDSRANAVYGLGFASENDLDQFAAKFAEIKELTKQPLTPQPNQPPPNFRRLENGGSDHVDSIRPNDSRSSLPSVNASLPSAEYMNAGSGDQRTKVGAATTIDNTNQLKYENDRLKVALAQSSANAKKWESELQTLKNNNARLAAGLQESNQNVEEWKKQLNTYKEDNAMLKKQLTEKEHQGSSQEVSKLQGEVYSALSQLNSAQNEKQALEKELSALRSKLQTVTGLEEKDRVNERIIRELRSENSELSSKLGSAKMEAERMRSSQSQDRSDLSSLRDTVSRCTSDLTSAQHVISRLLNS